MLQVFIADNSIQLGAVDIVLVEFSKHANITTVDKGDRIYYIDRPLLLGEELSDNELDLLACLDDHLNNTTDDIWEHYDDGGCYNLQHIKDELECYCGMDDCVALRLESHIYHGPELVEVIRIVRA